MKNIIDAIENEIYDKTCEAHDNGEPEPKFVVVFSPKGYNDARADRVATVYFNERHGMGVTSFAGYPYEIDEAQDEDFTIQETN